MSDVRDPATDQQLPVRNDNPAIQDLVIADIEERKALGLSKYGTLLQANNGRDMLLDAYQEALDLVVYLKGRLEEDRLRAEREAEIQEAWQQPGLWRGDLFEGDCTCVDPAPCATGYNFLVCAKCMCRVSDEKLVHKQ
jgi:hypothetical protein